MPSAVGSADRGASPHGGAEPRARGGAGPPPGAALRRHPAARRSRPLAWAAPVTGAVPRGRDPRGRRWRRSPPARRFPRVRQRPTAAACQQLPLASESPLRIAFCVGDGARFSPCRIARIAAAAQLPPSSTRPALPPGSERAPCTWDGGGAAHRTALQAGARPRDRFRARGFQPSICAPLTAAWHGAADGSGR